MADSALPRISVCLLTYKRARVLPRTLDALLAQTHGDFELIINDDCSPDDTEAVCREYERRDHRVRYCRNPRNLRYAGNQNAALLRATTDYVAIVHDGDFYHPDLLEQWTQALVTHPSAALVFNVCEQLDEHGKVLQVHPSPYPNGLIPGRQLLDEMLVVPGSPIFGIVMVRRARALEVGPFDPRLPVLADVDMWMRLLQRYDIAHVTKPLFGIAPRESDHHNNYDNWRVTAERELIYGLNMRRRSASGLEHARMQSMRLRMTGMLWQLRLRQFATCLRHGKLDAAREGLRYSAKQPWPLALGDTPDSVLSWNSFKASAELGSPDLLEESARL